MECIPLTGIRPTLMLAQGEVGKSAFSKRPSIPKRQNHILGNGTSAKNCFLSSGNDWWSSVRIGNLSAALAAIKIATMTEN